MALRARRDNGAIADFRFPTPEKLREWLADPKRSGRLGRRRARSPHLPRELRNRFRDRPVG
jgi:hypothetical protein